MTEQKAFQTRLASGQKMEAVGRLTDGEGATITLFLPATAPLPRAKGETILLL